MLYIFNQQYFVFTLLATPELLGGGVGWSCSLGVNVGGEQNMVEGLIYM